MCLSAIASLNLLCQMGYGLVMYQLKCLRYFERQLVAHVQSNKCIFQVSVANGNGLSKMIATAISFQQPVHKIYHILPRIILFGNPPCGWKPRISKQWY